MVCLRPPPLSVFLVTLLSTFPHRIQALGLLQTHSPLQSQTCNRPSLALKGLAIIDAPMTSRANLLPTKSPIVKVSFRCDMPIESQTRITLVEDGGFRDTL